MLDCSRVVACLLQLPVGGGTQPGNHRCLSVAPSILLYSSGPLFSVGAIFYFVMSCPDHVLVLIDYSPHPLKIATTEVCVVSGLRGMRFAEIEIVCLGYSYGGGGDTTDIASSGPHTRTYTVSRVILNSDKKCFCLLWVYGYKVYKQSVSVSRQIEVG